MRLRRLSDNSGTAEDTLLRSLFVPPAPTNVFSIAASTSASVVWTAPSATYIPPVTDYIVQYQPSGGSWATFSDGTSTATSATVTGLSSGTSYLFRVAAVNGVGTGSYGTATAVQSYAVSSASSNRNSYSSSGTADKAADGDSSTYFQSSDDNAFPVYLNYDLGSSKTVSLYRLQGASGGGYNDPSAWSLQGSSDNSTWTTLDTRSWPSSLAGGPYAFAVASPASYRYYRLNITALNAGGNAALAAFDVFGA